jgi:hypothetical protein
VGFAPQSACGDGRFDRDLAPPHRFVAAAVQFAMMPAAQRDGELIANLAAKRAALGEAKVIGVAGCPAADKTRLLGTVSDVLAITNPAGL